MILQAEYDAREATAIELLKMRYVQEELYINVPSAAHPAVALPLLAAWSRPPSRAGKAPLEIHDDTTATRRTRWIQLDLLDDIAWLLRLELVRNEQMFGCVVYKKGKASNHTIYVFGPPFFVT